MPQLTGPEFIPENNRVTSLVFMFHGYGADGQDLISIAPFFAQHLPNTAFFAPNGTEICEVSPFGRQWFSLEQSDPDFLRRSSQTLHIAFNNMYDEAVRAAPVLEDFIRHQMQRFNVSAENVILLGFSQGTMMSLHIGLRHTSEIAAIVGFSGALVGAEHLLHDIKSKPPVLLVHVEADDMLPVRAVDIASETLEQCNVPHQVIKRPRLPHSIDKTGALKAAEFMQTILDTKKAP